MFSQRNNFKLCLLWCVCALIFLPLSARSQVRISATGSCTITYDVTDLTGDPGTDFIRTKRTVRGDVILEISRARDNPPFRD
jgi:hypothetical protein